MQSARYSWEGSPLMFSRGNTLIASIRIAWALLEYVPFHTFTANPKSNDRTRTAVPDAAHRLRHHGRRAPTAVTDPAWSFPDGPGDFSRSANGSGIVWPSTWEMNRYPRFGRVSIKHGVSAESFKASRSLLMALFSPWSKLTNVSFGQSFWRNSSRVTTLPGRSSSMART